MATPRHDPGRLRLLVPAPAGGPARGDPGPGAYYVKYRPVFEAAAARAEGQPQPGRAVRGRLRARRPARPRHRRQPRPPTGPRGLRRRQDDQRRAAGDRLPERLLPRHRVEERHALGRDRDRLGRRAARRPRAQLRADLATAATWAKAYIAQGHPAGSDTLNLYDTGAIAESELLAEPCAAGPDDFSAIAPAALVNDLAEQLPRSAEDSGAKGDPFALGTGLGQSDAAPHAFGLYVTDQLYRPAAAPIRRVRPAAAQLRPRRERVGLLVRGRRRNHLPALPAERDRQPGGLAHRARRHPARRGHRRPERPR